MIDCSRVGTALARLQAKRRLSQNNSPFGALLGAAIEKGGPGLSRVPQPSVDPLPWADRLATRGSEREARDQNPQP